MEKNILLVIIACAALVISGCNQGKSNKDGSTASLKEQSRLILNFQTNDTTDYKVTTMSEDSIQFEGKLPEKIDTNLKKNLTRAEISYTQKILSINQQGNAVAQITINEVKFQSVYKNDTMFDFDSTRDSDRSNVLYNMVGKGYTIELSPAGEVVNIIDSNQVLNALKGSNPQITTARTLVDAPAIKDRHGLQILPAKDNNNLTKELTWNTSQFYSFRMMGSKNFEKVYTLEKVRDMNGLKIADIQMNAIPAKMSDEMLKNQPKGDFAKMFDNNVIYKGNLLFDLTNGKISKYTENLSSEWVIVDPSAAAEQTPATLKMAAKRSYSIENIK